MVNIIRDSLIEDWALAGLSIKEIVEKLHNKEIPTATKTVSKVLKNKGFIYNNSNHSWDRSKTNKDIIVSNSDKVDTSEKLEIKNTIMKTNRNVNSIQLIEMLGFTPNEMDTLKVMITERIEGITTVEKESILGKVAKLKVRERKNKTYYISTDIVEGISNIAEKNGVKISNIVELALIDFIKQYNS